MIVAVAPSVEQKPFNSVLPCVSEFVTFCYLCWIYDFAARGRCSACTGTL